MPDEQLGLGRQADPPSDRLQQRDAYLALEHSEVLGDGRRVVGQRLGDRDRGAAVFQLTQQAEAIDIQHLLIIVCILCRSESHRRSSDDVPVLVN